jgi:blocked-early-in-transport protein 1
MNFRPKGANSSFVNNLSAANPREALFGTAKMAPPRQTLAEESQAMLEEANNRDIHALGEQVAHMKHLAFDIEAAIQTDRLHLDQMSGGFDRVGSAMRGTMAHLNKMLSTGGSKHMCYLVSFVLAVFFFLYWLMK